MTHPVSQQDGLPRLSRPIHHPNGWESPRHVDRRSFSATELWLLLRFAGLICADASAEHCSNAKDDPFGESLSLRGVNYVDPRHRLPELEMGLFIHHIETIIPSLSASQVVFTGGRSSDSYNQRILDSVKPYYVHDVKTALGITSTAKKAITKSIERHAKRASLDSLAVLRLLAAAQVVAEKVGPKMSMGKWLDERDEQMKHIFGDRIIADSSAVLDEQRADRE